MIVRVVRFHRMIRFTCPSTAPELYVRVNPLRTAAWSVSSPGRSDASAGRSSAETADIDEFNCLPRRSVSISANDRHFLQLLRGVGSWREPAPA